MLKRSRGADIERARAHKNNRGAVSVNALNDPAASESSKEATVTRLTNALAKIPKTEMSLVLETPCVAEGLAIDTPDNNVDTFAQELNAIFDPPYGSVEWINETENLFSDPDTQVFIPAKPKSLLQKIKPIKSGRYAKESTPSRFNKLRSAIGAIASSLAVQHSPFGSIQSEKVTTAPVKKIPPKRPIKKSTTTQFEHSYAQSRRRKNRQAIAGMVAGATIFTGLIFATSAEKDTPRERTPEAAASMFESPSSVPSAEVDRASTTTNPSVEDRVLDQTNTLSPIETPAQPDTMTVTIESGSNIWDAIKTELQKHNPDVKNAEVARVVNSIILFYNLENPDYVLPGTTFDVDMVTLNSIS